jgi:hypothetical protein
LLFGNVKAHSSLPSQVAREEEKAPSTATIHVSNPSDGHLFV